MATEITVRVDKTIGPIFPWELPVDFDLWFSRLSGGYWQAWGFWPGGQEMCAVDVMIDRDMWQ
ncbi:MAG: hypothetical protein DRP65_10890 [Planctomycetota bacterium]|nr:MAG: hypothetical protein DRP65_10890 [Planctomycetota bacterium]